MNVVIARQLGAEEAGLFFLAYTIVFIAAAVSRLGLDNTFVRFIAARHATNEWGWIKGLYGSVGFLLSMTGHEKLLRNNVLIAAVTTLALGFTLVPPHGIMGAAIATACGVALQNLLGVWQVRRVLGFNTLAIWR